MNAISMLMVQEPKGLRAAEPSSRPNDPSLDLSPGAAAFALLFQQAVEGAAPSAAEAAGEGGEVLSQTADAAGGAISAAAALPTLGGDRAAGQTNAGEGGGIQTGLSDPRSLGAGGVPGAVPETQPQTTAPQPVETAQAPVAVGKADSLPGGALQTLEVNRPPAQPGVNPGGATGLEVRTGSKVQGQALVTETPASADSDAAPLPAATETGQNPGVSKAAVAEPEAFESGNQAVLEAVEKGAEAGAPVRSAAGSSQSSAAAVTALTAAETTALHPEAGADLAKGAGQPEPTPQLGGPSIQAPERPRTAAAGQGETGTNLGRQTEKKSAADGSVGRSDSPQGASFSDAAAQALMQTNPASRPGPTAAATTAVSTPTPPADRPDPKDVLGQVLGRLKVSAGTDRTEARIHLVPAELGPVDLRVTLEGGQMTARFHVASGQVKDILEQHLPELKQALQDQGIRVEQFSVSFGSGTMQQHASQERQAQAWQGPAAYRGHRSYGRDGGGQQDQPEARGLSRLVAQRLDLIA